MKWHFGALANASPAEIVKCDLLDSIDMEDTPLDALTTGVGEFVGIVMGTRGVTQKALVREARRSAAESRAQAAQTFIEDCVTAANGVMSCASLYARYRAWGTHLLPHHLVSASRFEQELLKAHPRVTRESRWLRGRKVSVYAGVAFTPDCDTAEALAWCEEQAQE